MCGGLVTLILQLVTRCGGWGWGWGWGRPFNPQEKIPATHWMEVGIGPAAGLILLEINIHLPRIESRSFGPSIRILVVVLTTVSPLIDLH